MPEVSCQTCFFSRQLDGARRRGLEVVECRRFPAAEVIKKHPEDWCGEHQAFLRGRAATAALQGLLAAVPQGHIADPKSFARDAFRFADALLTESIQELPHG